MYKTPRRHTVSLRRQSNYGFSLIELLVVITILAIAATIGAVFLVNQVAKGRDARRKDDLHRIKLALEEYFSDKGVYPPGNPLATCNGTALQPYLVSVPCDPTTRLPYAYQVLATPSRYRVMTTLEQGGDSSSTTLFCNPTCGVTIGGVSTFNYGVSGGTTVCLRTSSNNCPNNNAF